MNRYSQYIELLTEETLDHTVGKAVAAAMGVKIKTFAREKYRNGGDTGALLYTFTADVTMEQIIAALTKSGFKAPKNPSINRDHESMRAFTNNAVSRRTSRPQFRSMAGACACASSRAKRDKRKAPHGAFFIPSRRTSSRPSIA